MGGRARPARASGAAARPGAVEIISQAYIITADQPLAPGPRRRSHTMSPKVVLTCAVTGGGRPHPRHGAIPITPAQIAASCLEAAQEGASAVHIHVRNPQTGLSSDDPHLFDEVVDRIRSSGVDIIINLTCGMGALFVPDPEDESRPLPSSKIYPVPKRMRL